MPCPSSRGRRANGHTVQRPLRASDTDFVSLLHRLRANDPSLTSLLLNRQMMCAAEYAQLIAFGVAFAVNHTVQHLEVERCGNFAHQTELLIAISDVLRTNSAIESLRVVDVNAESATALAGALRQNSTLRSLSIRVCDGGCRAGHVIGEALKVNASLRSLSWEDDAATKQTQDDTVFPCDDSGPLIAKALLANASVERLTIHTCESSYQTRAAVAKLLRHTCTLRALCLRCPADCNPTVHTCVFECGAVKSLADALKTNQSLVELQLHGMRLGESASVLLANATLSHASLKSLSLTPVQFGNQDIVQECSNAAKLDQALDMSTQPRPMIVIGTPIAHDADDTLLEDLREETLGNALDKYLRTKSRPDASLLWDELWDRWTDKQLVDSESRATALCETDTAKVCEEIATIMAAEGLREKATCLVQGMQTSASSGV